MKRWGLLIAFFFSASFGFCQQDTALKHRADRLMISAAADYDKDQRISVAELQKFVSSEVQKLTQAAQKPTARQENLDND